MNEGKFVKDIDWKKAFHNLELIAAPMGLSEEIQDILKEAEYLRPKPKNKYGGEEDGKL